MIGQIRRRMMMGGSAKPYDAEVEYLRNSEYGTYINTGIYPSNDTNIYMQVRNIAFPSGGKDFNYFGASEDRWGGTGFNRAISLNRQNDIYFLCNNSYSVKNIGTIPYYEILTIKVEGNKLTYKNLSVTGKAGTYRVSLPMYLWANNIKNDDPRYCNIADVFSFQIKEVNQIILDLIPVRKNGIGYMYDKVSGQLFGNAGTGQFIIGPDK